jgi:dihydroorotase
MPLLVHGEVTHAEIDIFDREARFIETVMEPLRQRLPGLKVVFEHITTKDAAEYVRDGNELLAATITPQHLMFNRNHMLVGGVRPHLYCLPILKRNIHQQALRELVASGLTALSSAPIPLRTPAIVRKPAADAPAALTRRPRWAATPRCLKR